MICKQLYCVGTRNQEKSLLVFSTDTAMAGLITQSTSATMEHFLPSVGCTCDRRACRHSQPAVHDAKRSRSLCYLVQKKTKQKGNHFSCVICCPAGPFPFSDNTSLLGTPEGTENSLKFLLGEIQNQHKPHSWPPEKRSWGGLRHREQGNTQRCIKTVDSTIPQRDTHPGTRW